MFDTPPPTPPPPAPSPHSHPRKRKKERIVLFECAEDGDRDSRQLSKRRLVSRKTVLSEITPLNPTRVLTEIQQFKGTPCKQRGELVLLSSAQIPSQSRSTAKVSNPHNSLAETRAFALSYLRASVPTLHPNPRQTDQTKHK